MPVQMFNHRCALSSFVELSRIIGMFVELSWVESQVRLEFIRFATEADYDTLTVYVSHY